MFGKKGQNFGQEFLKIVDKNFPKKNPLSKIINRKTLKIGYSCTKNMASIIQGHNQQIMKNNWGSEEKKDGVCNCRDKSKCPLDGKCCTKGVVYQASLPSGEVYIGSTGQTFKQRYNGHASNFRHAKYKNSTTLSNYVWENKIDPKAIKWSILKRAKPYQPGNKMCTLCVTEKLFILNNSHNCINRRDEIS